MYWREKIWHQLAVMMKANVRWRFRQVHLTHITLSTLVNVNHYISDLDLLQCVTYYVEFIIFPWNVNKSTHTPSKCDQINHNSFTTIYDIYI